MAFIGESKSDHQQLKDIEMIIENSWRDYNDELFKVNLLFEFKKYGLCKYIFGEFDIKMENIFDRLNDVREIFLKLF